MARHFPSTFVSRFVVRPSDGQGRKGPGDTGEVTRRQWVSLPKNQLDAQKPYKITVCVYIYIYIITIKSDAICKHLQASASICKHLQATLFL